MDAFYISHTSAQVEGIPIRVFDVVALCCVICSVYTEWVVRLCMGPMQSNAVSVVCCHLCQIIAIFHDSIY